MVQKPKKAVAGILAVILVVILVAGGLATPPPATQAQQLTTNVVLLQFSYYLGINPPLTAGEIELGASDRPFSVSYRFSGLDLRNEPLSCDAPVLDNDAEVTGRVGYRYLITVQGRTYELRSNANGTQVIRCYFGEEIDWLANPRGIGPTIDGIAATNTALRHLSGYLGTDVTLTVDRAENPEEGDPRVFYRYNPFVYLDASMGCPARDRDYAVQDTLAYRVRLTVNGLFYDYRVRADGSVVVLCRFGRPDESSIGLDLESTVISSEES